MYRIPGVLSAATTKPAPAVPAVRPTPGLPPGGPQPPEDGRATGRERIALSLNDVVVRRLLTAGQDLQAALGLMGNHPASGKVRHAVDEMDQAIRDIRDTIFDHPSGERPPSTHPRAQPESGSHTSRRGED
jgi:hypothetical protein